MGRRVLVTGLGTFWGARVARALEADPDVEAIIGIGVDAPRIELDRTEYVPADASYSILSRLVKATQVDTIVHTHLVVDQTQMPMREVHEVNVIGTMNLLAAASDPASSVRDIIVKSSTIVYGSAATDPAWFDEDTPRSPGGGRSRIEASLEEVEAYVRDYAIDNPHVSIALLRFCKVLGDDLQTPISRSLQRPLVPCVAGFDPRFQFVHEADVVRAIVFVLDHGISGVFNVAGDGVIPWSEVVATCGKHMLPLPPYGTEIAAATLRLGGLDLPSELLSLLRYGRGVDNSRLKDLGFRYEHTTAGTVRAFAETARLRATVGDARPAYRYERDVEQFFRHSPTVVRDPETGR